MSEEISAMMNPESVETKEDFLRFLEGLLTDYDRDRDSWENPDLGMYLEAMLEWVKNHERVFIHLGRPLPENINWKFMAIMLYAAKIYE